MCHPAPLDPLAADTHERGGRTMAPHLPKWSTLRWVTVIFNLTMLLGMVLFIAVLLATADGAACAGLDPAQAGNFPLCWASSGGSDGPPLGELLLLWVGGDLVLLALWLCSKPASRTCQACGSCVKPGSATCPSCAHDLSGFVPYSPASR